MFINPITIIQNGWITHPECTSIEDFKARKFISPNAIDFTVDTVHGLDKNYAVVGEQTKKMRNHFPWPLSPASTGDRSKPSWELTGSNVYDGLSKMYVIVPEGYIAILISRSTFTRNGVFLTSGWYDSGFQGAIGFTFYTLGGGIVIEQGVRFGQIGFIKADSAGNYLGGYSHVQNTLPSHIQYEQE